MAVSSTPIVAQPGIASNGGLSGVPSTPDPTLGRPSNASPDCAALEPIVQQWTDWDWTWAMAVIWRESRCHCDSVNSQEVAGGNRAEGPFQVLEPMHADITIGDPLTCQGGIATGHALWLADGRSPWQ